MVLCISVFLLACSGFVSASEIAFFSLGPQDLDTLEARRHPSDARILALREQSERLLATVLILNNLVNVAIIILMDFFFSHVINFGGSEALEFIFVTVVLTFVLLLFGEIVPKVYSAQRTLGFCRTAAPVFSVLIKVCHPLSSLLMRSKGLTTKIVSHQVEALTMDDLEQALELTDKGELQSDENQMLQGIIRFGEETVREVMTPRVDLTDLDINTPFPQVLALVRENRVSRIPVYSGTEDNIKGVLYIKDLLPHLTKPANFRWQSLIRAPFFVPETKMVDDLLRDFQRNKVHIAIVVDEYGGTCGIVTMEDILEEIVGEIDDEFDQRKRSYTRLNQRTYLVDGKCQLGDLCRILNLPDDYFQNHEGDAETLAGLLLEIKGGFPEVGERLQCRQLSLEAVELDQHRIASVKVIVGT